MKVLWLVSITIPAAADACGLPREDGCGHIVQTDVTHLFTKAQHLALHHSQCGIGGDVTRGGACTARSED